MIPLITILLFVVLGGYAFALNERLSFVKEDLQKEKRRAKDLESRLTFEARRRADAEDEVLLLKSELEQP